MNHNPEAHLRTPDSGLQELVRLESDPATGAYVRLVHPSRSSSCRERVESSRVCEHSRARVTALRMCICRTRLTSSSSSMSADADVLRRALLAFLPPPSRHPAVRDCSVGIPSFSLTHSCLNRKLKLPALIYTKHTVLSGRLAAELESAAAALSESQTQTRSAAAVHPRHPRCKMHGKASPEIVPEARSLNQTENENANANFQHTHMHTELRA